MNIGLDIGGANIKAFDGSNAYHIPFALWQAPESLSAVLGRELPGQPKNVFVTMTGELCDCFESRRQGVCHIVDQVAGAFPNSDHHFYSTRGLFLKANTAQDRWSEVASANWHATAMDFCMCNADQSGVIVDVGSTTSDIIPFRFGSVVARGHDDLSRIRNGELIYSGLSRTPISSVVSTVGLDGVTRRLAFEFFASMCDAYLLAGLLTTSSLSLKTADGRPLEVEFSKRRLARLLCSEPESLPEELLIEIARLAVDVQLQEITKSISDQLQHHELDPLVVIAGESPDTIRRGLQSLEQRSGNGTKITFQEMDLLRGRTAAAQAVLRIGLSSAMS
ncbi:MAG: hydantoinase/oxoprolinase family protein [Pirellulaceae bacterium]